MERLLNRCNAFFEQVPDTARRYRWLIWSLFFILNIVIISGVSKFKIDMTMEAYFQADDPTKLAYDVFREQFGSDDVIFLNYEAKDGDVFSDQSLKALYQVQDQLLNYRLSLKPNETSRLDHITEVKSLINVAYLESHSDSLISNPLIGKNLPKNASEREALRAKAIEHADIERVFVSPDSRFATILVKTNLGAEVISPENELDQPQANNLAEEYSIDDELIDDELITAGGIKDSEEREYDPLDDMQASWEKSQSTTATQDLPKTQFKQAEIEDYALVMEAINPILHQPNVTDVLAFYPAGMGPLMEFFNEIILKQLATVFVLSVLLILVVLWVLFRSLSAVVWSMSVVLLSLLWVIGLIGWSGATMTMMINIIVFLIIAVGVADAIHILSGYIYFRNLDQPHEQALRSVFKKSGLACFLTSLTTAIGLIALTLVPIVPVKNFGIFASFGVLFAFMITVFVLPLMLDLWAPKKNRSDKNKDQDDDSLKDHIIQRVLKRIENVGYNNPKKIIAFFTLFTVFLISGMFNIKINSNLVELLPEGAPIATSVDIIDKNMAGSSVMDILFDANQANAFKDPKVLNKMEEIDRYIHEHYGAGSQLALVGKTTSLVNITKDAYRALHNNNQAYYRIPQDPTMLAQTLFMFNNANAKDRRQMVSDDYRQARMTITLKNAGSYVYVPMVEDIQRKMDNLFKPTKAQYPDFEVSLTGNISLMFKLVDYISWSQVKSFGLALVVISLLLLIVFGSVRIGIIALFPNLMPIFLAFGLMGHFNIPLDTDTLLIAPIIIGIAVDDTIHFLTHYRAGMHETGNIKTAIQLSIREAGQAITFTSLVLGIGFLVFLFSPHMALKNFGVLSSLAIFVALFTDLLLLPALCRVFNADFNRSKTTMTEGKTI